MRVFIIAALTTDGFIAKHRDHPADWTSREDKKLFVELTKQAGTIVMGSRTFTTIGRALPGRTIIVYSSQPTPSGIEGVEMTSEDPSELVKRLEAKGEPTLAICGGASIYRLFMAAGLVDELYLTIEPKFFGQGVTLFDEPLEADLELLETWKLNRSTAVMHYTVVKNVDQTSA